MANSTRILFVAGEVAPFSEVSETASLVRTLPEQLQEAGNYEARITMPRYGTVSERKNRLHEVIRLSGTDVPMGDATETLKVKVASIPGIRLQVYFMDNKRLFKRKGLHASKKDVLFEDNTERALFYGRSVLETVRKLRWGPDIVHAFGWISGFVPLLLRTEYADDELFHDVRTLYTPDSIDAGAHLTADFVDAMELSIDGAAVDQDLRDLGASFADIAILPPSLEPSGNNVSRFSANTDEITQQALSLYDELLNSVPA